MDKEPPPPSYTATMAPPYPGNQPAEMQPQQYTPSDQEKPHGDQHGQQYPPGGQQQYAPAGGQPYPPAGGQQYPPPGGQQYPPPGGPQYPPPGGQQYPPPAGQQYQPPAGQQYQPPAGQQYAPTAGQQYPMTGQPQPIAGQPGSNVVVMQTTGAVPGGGCPNCQAGIIVENYSTLGICLAICCFPLGLICCLMMREKKCSNCGATF